MKTKYLVMCLAAAFLSAFTASSQTTLAKWTFDTLSITAGSTYTNYGNGKVITNVLAEVGTGTA